MSTSEKAQAELFGSGASAEHQKQEELMQGKEQQLGNAIHKAQGQGPLVCVSRRPIIGIVQPRQVIANGSFIGSYRVYAVQAYVEAVTRAGGLPLTLPFVAERELVEQQVAACDGLLLCGGADIDARLYGEEPRQRQGWFDRELDLFYLNAIAAARQQKKPLLGICRGIQAINVAYGGTLIQDIPSEMPGALLHEQNAPAAAACHGIKVEREGFFAGIYPEEHAVNSFHHQAVGRLGDGLLVRARSADGIVEALEGRQDRGEAPMLGVQWHPEMLCAGGDAFSLSLFSSFVKLCG